MLALHSLVPLYCPSPHMIAMSAGDIPVKARLAGVLSTKYSEVFNDSE
ncbi:protein of unknown function [Candidatus Methylomirabilis oxygeniifera]|uniref:Uncharacterized protein n=1 Tax=Methylomirabilis oxygeniifera TaxID=671143 RepID=D5MHC7_METO1|nr:protein of unknown function [Candidatus Methylomirabilis oxyfera]